MTHVWNISMTSALSSVAMVSKWWQSGHRISTGATSVVLHAIFVEPSSRVPELKLLKYGCYQPYFGRILGQNFLAPVIAVRILRLSVRILSEICSVCQKTATSSPPFFRVTTGQGKLENDREFVLSGKCQGKWSWIMQTADNCDFSHLQILKSRQICSFH